MLKKKILCKNRKKHPVLKKKRNIYLLKIRPSDFDLHLGLSLQSLMYGLIVFIYLFAAKVLSQVTPQS